MSLMFRLTKKLHVIGKIVALYSFFCVLQVLVDIKKEVFYVGVLINNTHSCPRLIGGKISIINSPTQVLGLWMHFVVILKMCFFVYSL